MVFSVPVGEGLGVDFLGGEGKALALHLSFYALDLPPVEGIWSLLRRGWLSNVAFTTPERLNQCTRLAYGRASTYSKLIDGGCLRLARPSDPLEQHATTPRVQLSRNVRGVQRSPQGMMEPL